MNSFSGTAPSRACRSTRSWSLGSASFLRIASFAAGTINGRLAAVRRLAYEAADAGLLSPELAAGIRRVKSVKKLGVRLGNWLTAEEARRFLQAPAPDTLKGHRTSDFGIHDRDAPKNQWGGQGRSNRPRQPVEYRKYFLKRPVLGVFVLAPASAIVYA